MASPASALQLAANRANALLSTGPRSEEGRLTSSANAKTHGLTTRHALLPGEDRNEFELHHQAYTDLYRPRGPISQELVTELADLRWRLQRVPAFEAQLINGEFIKLTTESEFQPIIKNLTNDTQIIALAFKRLVECRVLPNLFNQEARLARRADKLEAHLEARRSMPLPLAPPPVEEPRPKGAVNDPPVPLPENQKIEPNPSKPQPIRVIAQRGRNEPCPCDSGRKFKHCCLNKTAAASPASQL